MEKKFKLGQFYTTRANYIIGNLVSDIPKDKIVVEPFCGNGDLLIVDNEFELYDIDPKIDGCIKRDTLLDPPSYSGKIVITNPPFLARNKNSDKRIYDFYNVNDLYKASIKSILKSFQNSSLWSYTSLVKCAISCSTTNSNSCFV